MDENDLFEWLQKERSSAHLAAVPENAYSELLGLFKEKSSEHDRKNLGDCFSQIYNLRERKILLDVQAKACGFVTLLINMMPEEQKMQSELLTVLSEARHAIFPFLHLPCGINQKPEFD